MKEVRDIGYIYKITNTVSGLSYIGQTTVSVHTRWRSHVCSAYNLNSTSYNLHLQKAIRKYGEKAFSVDTIEECDNSILSEREKYWIALYGSADNGYNISRGGEGKTLYSDKELLDAWNSGMTLTEISSSVGININTLGIRIKTLGVTKEEIRKRANVVDKIKNSKAVCQYDLDGNFVREFKSVNEACAVIGAKYLTLALHGKVKICRGYQWRDYKTDKIEPYDPHHYHGKNPVYQYTLDGDFIREYKSYAQAAKACNRDRKAIYYACQGLSKTSGGFRWSNEKIDKLPPLESNFKKAV